MVKIRSKFGAVVFFTRLAAVTTQPFMLIGAYSVQGQGTLTVLETGGGQPLVSASPMKAGTQWIRVTNIPTTVTSNTFNVILPITNAEQLFRLRQQ